MTRRESWLLNGADDQLIRGETHHPVGAEPRATLVICHGFKGYKDYGFFPQLAEHAAEAGVTAHRFNFSHSGMTDRIETFERPDLFERDTWGRQIEDLSRVLQGRTSETNLPVVVFGHSRGGVTSILTLARLEIPIAGLVTAAAPAEACSLDDAQRRILHKQGWLSSPSGRTGQDLHVGVAWLKEIESDPAAFDPVAAIGRIDCPVLIIHGDDDSTVPVAAASRLAEASHTKPLIIPGATHTFNAPNPLPIEQTPPPQTQQLYDAIFSFIDRVSA